MHFNNFSRRRLECSLAARLVRKFAWDTRSELSGAPLQISANFSFVDLSAQYSGRQSASNANTARPSAAQKCEIWRAIIFARPSGAPANLCGTTKTMRRLESL